MNNIVGYKEDEWKLLLIYRKALDFDRTNKLSSLERTERNYSKIFKEYVG